MWEINSDETADGAQRGPQDSRTPQAGFVARAIREEDIEVLRAHERTGRPLGDAKFLAMLEQKRDRILALQKPGPQPRAEAIAKRCWPRRPSAGIEE